MSSEIPGYTKITKQYLREKKEQLLEKPLYQKPPALPQPMLFGTIQNINDDTDGNQLNSDNVTISYLPMPSISYIIMNTDKNRDTLYVKNSDIGLGGSRRRKTKTRKINKRKSRKSYKKY